MTLPLNSLPGKIDDIPLLFAKLHPYEIKLPAFAKVFLVIPFGL